MNKLKPTMQMPNGLSLDNLARDPDVIRAYKSDPHVHNKISVRLAVELLRAGEWALAHAAEFPLPLLLVHGTADELTSAAATKEFASKAPGDCTLKMWDGFYHETHTSRRRRKCWVYGNVAWITYAGMSREKEATAHETGDVSILAKTGVGGGQMSQPDGLHQSGNNPHESDCEHSRSDSGICCSAGGNQLPVPEV